VISIAIAIGKKRFLKAWVILLYRNS
jgi:hypothetical protein